jgi:cytidine deaminase
MYQKLIQAAREAREGAYAPYSGFKVGAALLTKKGTIFTGCNVENASYGLSICAERTAVFKAVCAGETDFVALALFTGLEEPSSPCGACRQVLAEFSPGVKVIMVGKNDRVREASLGELLPLTFQLTTKTKGGE